MSEPTDSSATSKKIHGPWPSVESDVVSPTMRVGAAWSWRFLVISAGLLVIGFVIVTLSEVAIPIAIAMLLAALLHPLKDILVRHGMKPNLAAPLVFVGGIIVVLGIVAVVIEQFVAGASGLAEQASGGLQQIRDWLERGPLDISKGQLSSAINSAEGWVSENRGKLTSGALNTALSAGHIVAGGLIAMFTLFFFLRDGRKIWNWILGLTPEPARPHIDAAAGRAWDSLGGYVKATALVALVDAVGIGIVIALVGVPLVFPLAALVFLTAFIPLVGAVLSGLVATLIALVTVGPVGALIVLGGVILVNQLEAHLLQPLLMGHAVKLHPLAVVLSIATGGLLIGVTGALLAVPAASALNSAIKSLRGKFDEPADAQGTVDTHRGESPDNVERSTSDGSNSPEN